jgi:1-deoxy-D-xylulose-5-phosphate synthase
MIIEGGIAMLLETIQGPAALRKLSLTALTQLAQEIRTVLLQKLSITGGHTGPNLGVVELTIALHTVFETPIDQLIFDVSHQAYVHKMLTGRAQAFIDPAHYADVSGFTDPQESPYDLFAVGHTSTSLALASGVAKARDLQAEHYNVVAVIGDGALSGGLAYEGLNNIVAQGTNTIVIVNDNERSIAENHGGLYGNLQALRVTQGQAPNNFFKALGFDYHYLEAGNDLAALIPALQQIKDTPRPVLLHVHTQKGKGYALAEQQPEKFHHGGPFDLATGAALAPKPALTYSSLTADFMLQKMAQDPKVVALNAGAPMLLFTPAQRRQAGAQFVDVGIAEQQAATMTTGLARNGAKPVWAVLSSFMQRSFDQISHDLALNDLPGTILVYGASVHGKNEQSHLGIFDIPFLSHIPNLIYLAPTTQHEYLAMLDWAIDQTGHPVAIRVPVGPVIAGPIDETDYQAGLKNQITQQGTQVALFGVGNFYQLAVAVAQALFDQAGIRPTVINPKLISDVDATILSQLPAQHQLVVTLEDGILSGGYGQMVASYLGNVPIKVQNYGLAKTFPDRFDAEQLLAAQGLTVPNIVQHILAAL